MKNVFVTTPGVPRPTIASRFTAIRVENTKSLLAVPAGEAVSKVYPWISGVKQIVSGVAQAETRITRVGYGSSAFINNTDRLISIDQLRLFTIPPIVANSVNRLVIGNRLGIKVRHTDFEIVSEWLPCGMLVTQNNLVAMAGRTNLCMSLPTPYYLQAGHPFRLRIRSTSPYNAAINYSFFMTLFGKDPKNGKPYELCKQITIPYRATPVVSDANPLYVDVVFDDNRDYPMRDMLLTHVIFAVTPFTFLPAIAPLVMRYVQQLDFQFIPPEGPKWMDFADWAPLGNLVDQAVATELVIYKPNTPILLYPTQQIDIDVKALVGLYWSEKVDTYEVPLWVTLIGTQEQVT